MSLSAQLRHSLDGQGMASGRIGAIGFVACFFGTHGATLCLMQQLSRLQRIKRRISLLGGSYTHPDGTIELDIDAPAGVDPRTDSQEVIEEKFARYFGAPKVERRPIRILMSLLPSLGFVAVAIIYFPGEWGDMTARGKLAWASAGGGAEDDSQDAPGPRPR